MKTSIKIGLVTFLVILSFCTMADGRPVKRSINFSMAKLAIHHYIDVMTEGQSQGIEELFSSDFCQRVQGLKYPNHSRSELISFLKKQSGEKMNCQTTLQIIDECAHYMIAKVIMKFESFTKTDLITLINEDGNWKVIASIHTYQ